MNRITHTQKIGHSHLYSNTTAQQAMRQLFQVAPDHDRLGNAEPLTAIYPNYDGPVVRSTEDGERELVSLSWGFRTTNKSKERLIYRFGCADFGAIALRFCG